MNPITNFVTFTDAPTLLSAIPYATITPNGNRSITRATERTITGVIRLLVQEIGDMEITAVSPQHIRQFITNAQGRNLSPVTVNSYLRAIKTYYGLLTKHGIIGHNPAQHIPFTQEPPRRHRAISKSNYRAMINAADNARDKAIIATLWATGARLSGLISMDASTDKLDHWHSKNGRSCYAMLVTEKFGKSRWVYMKGKPARYMDDWLRERPLTICPALFLTNRAPHRLTTIGAQHVLRKARITANIPPGQNTNAHAFRHAFAIRMLNKGYDLAVVSQWLGHSSPEFTAKVYAVRSERELRNIYFK